MKLSEIFFIQNCFWHISSTDAMNMFHIGLVYMNICSCYKIEHQLMYSKSWFENGILILKEAKHLHLNTGSLVFHHTIRFDPLQIFRIINFHQKNIWVKCLWYVDKNKIYFSWFTFFIENYQVFYIMYISIIGMFKFAFSWSFKL